MPWRRSRTPPTSSGRWGRTGAEEAEQAAGGPARAADRGLVLGRRPTRAATSPSPSTGTGLPSTASAPTWATCSAPARSPPRRPPPWRPRSRVRSCSTPSGCAPSAAATAASTRSATTPGSIWTHDTAIVALGLAREGHTARRPPRWSRAAARLGGGLRLPLARALLGRADDGPSLALPGLLPAAGVVGGLRGRARHGGPGAARPTARAGCGSSPPRPAPFGALSGSRACGFRGHAFSVAVEPDGAALVTGLPHGSRCPWRSA